MWKMRDTIKKKPAPEPLTWKEISKMVDDLEPIVYQSDRNGITKQYIVPENNLPKMSSIFDKYPRGNFFCRPEDTSVPIIFYPTNENETIIIPTAKLPEDFVELKNVSIVRGDGIVEPVGVSYEETYSPRSTGYQ
jgi:hypothetical protein